MNNGNDMNQTSNMRHMAMNNDKIDSVHDRRNKYLGANNGATSNGEDATSMERTKPYSKHLMPLSPSNGSASGRGVSNGPAGGGGSITSPISHPLDKIMSPAGGRGGKIKPLGSINHDKHIKNLNVLNSNSAKPVERFRNLEPINKFQ